MKVPHLLIIFLLFFFACLIANADENKQYKLQNAFPKLSFDNPVDLQHASDGTNRIFVVSQKGLIYVFKNTSSVKSAKFFLDIRDKVKYGSELGLLGLAFHPDYKNNGYFYVNYTASDPLRSVIARYTVRPKNRNSANKNSERILLEVNQPYSNHNGGQLAFGTDGYLYIALGDGGSGGDPQNNGQKRSTLLGKMLRIDVNCTSGNKNYCIPQKILLWEIHKAIRKKSMPMVYAIPGDSVLTLLQAGCGQETLDRMIGKKLTLLKKEKITAGELWKEITAIILPLTAIYRDLPYPYGNMGIMIQGNALSQAVMCIAAPNFQNCMGSISTAIIAAAGYGH